MKYEFKILYSPIKWISCLVLVILIPLVMYVPTYFDFVNVSSIYMPFVGIVLMNKNGKSLKRCVFYDFPFLFDNLKYTNPNFAAVL